MPLIFFAPYQIQGVTPGTGNSVLFNGVNDYIEYPYRAAYEFGTADWTIECFAQFNSTAANQTLLAFGNGGGSQSAYLWFMFDGAQLQLQEASASAGTAASFASSAWVPTVGTWYHLALVRYANVLTIYADGVAIGTKAFAGAQLGSMNAVVGALHYGSQGYTRPMNGLISNMRITTSAVYTAAFTRPASTLTRLPNTVLLTCLGDTISDISTQAATPTLGGNPAVDVRTPFATQPDLAYDPYYSSVTNLMHMDGVNGSTTITDQKGVVVTAGSTASISTSQSKYGGSSLSFDGSRNSATTFAMPAFGTGDFTVECWAYYTNVANTAGGRMVLDARPASTNGAYVTLGMNASSNWTFSVNGADQIIGSAVTGNAWHHVAVVRNSGSTKLYIDGVQVGSSYTDASNYLGGTATLGVNSFPSVTTGMLGYIDDVRITKGIARYTSNFTPRLSAFPDIGITNTGFDPYFDNVALLMHMDGTNNGTTFAETMANTPTVVGAVTTTSNFKYGTASASFGNGYVTFPASTFVPTATQAFTIEMWVNPTGTPSGTGTNIGVGAALPDANAIYWSFGLTSSRLVSMYVYNGAGQSFLGSTVVPTGTWSHISVSVSSTGAAIIFVNGVIDGTFTFVTPTANTVALCIGQSVNIKFPGLIDDLRITQGVQRYTAAFTPPAQAYADSFAASSYDPLFDQVSLLANGEGNLTVDATGKNTFTTATATQSTVRRFGTSSMQFGGTTATQMLAANSNALVISGATGTHTMEAWVYPTAFTNLAFIFGNAAVSLRISTAGLVTFVTNITRLTANGPIPLNTWTHIAVAASANNATLFINGVPQSSVQAVPTNFGNTFATIGMGIGSAADGTSPFTGYIDDVRITKNVCRYTSAFTPVKAGFATKSVAMDLTYDPYATSTVLQMRMEGANGGTTWVEDTGKVVTLTGTGTTTSTAQKKSGSSSTLFTSLNSFIAVPYSSDFAFGANDFTIEGWIYLNAYQASDRCQMIANWHGGVGSACAFGFGVLSTGFANFIYNASTNISAASVQVPLNQWVHLAFVRASNVGTIYQNGKQVATAALSATLNAGDLPVCIGGHSTASWAPNGYLDDVRVTKGVARYLGEFTPPTNLPLKTSNEYMVRYMGDPYAASVVFQMGFDGVRPTDTTQLALPTTTTAVTNGMTFVEGGSGAFTGASTITMPTNAKYALGTGSFTMEAWVYQTARSSVAQCTIVTTSANAATDVAPLLSIKANGTLMYQTWNAAVLTSTAIVPLNTWTHVAMTRSGTTTRLFINGDIVGTLTGDNRNFTDAFITVGSMNGGSQPFTGYLDNVRVTKGVARYTSAFIPTVTGATTSVYDPYFSNVVLLMHGDTGINSTSSNAVTFSTTGSVVVDTTNTKYGSGSIYIPTSSYISATGTWNIGTGDFTVEWWMKYLGDSRGAILSGVGAGNNAGGLPYIRLNSGDITINNNSIGLTTSADGNWHHFAVVRASGVTYGYKDGVLTGSVADTQNLPLSGTAQIGTVAGFFINAYIDELRVTSGVARYLSAFTPPTTSYPDQ